MLAIKLFYNEANFVNIVKNYVKLENVSCFFRLTDNAEEVKEYLKANGFYREDSYEFNEDEVAKRFPGQVVINKIF